MRDVHIEYVVKKGKGKNKIQTKRTKEQHWHYRILGGLETMSKAVCRMYIKQFGIWCEHKIKCKQKYVRLFAQFEHSALSADSIFTATAVCTLNPRNCYPGYFLLNLN